MDARDKIRRALMILPQMAAESDSETIKQDIELLTGVMLQLVGELAGRNVALAKQCRPRKAKPPKPNTQKGPKQEKGADSSTDTAKDKTGAEDRAKELSSIQQGIRQADPSLADQQRALRGKVYGAQNSDVAFRKAAQAIAR